MSSGTTKGKAFHLDGALWINRESDAFLGGGRVELLEKIRDFGSITRAAKAMKMSYKAAWDAVDAMNNVAGEPLVATAAGGKGGGGTRLTARGVQVVETYRTIQQEHRKFLEALNAGIDDLASMYRVIRRLSVKTSARNQFFGTVTSIRSGPVTAEVEIALAGGDRITATVTQESVDDLGLAPGKEAWALIKASWIVVAAGAPDMKLSARNQLAGTVARLIRGAINTEVVIALPGGLSVSALVTNEASDELQLAQGRAATAIFKASSVVLGVGA